MRLDEIAKCIPDEVVMPIAWAIYQATTGLEPGDERYEDDGYAYHWEEAITALASGLAAWPGAEHQTPKDWSKWFVARDTDDNEGDDELLWRRD